MKTFTRLLLGFVVAATAAPAVTYAHFKLLEPASWLVEDQRGDPQKSGPCGGSNTSWGTPSYGVTKTTGGQKLHVKWQETIYHPGYYRIALAVNSMNELPPDPVARRARTKSAGESTGRCQAKSQRRPWRPVLADGLNLHRDRPAQGTMLPAFETDVVLPNISCKKCTLQVIQFMEEHAYNNPGGYNYHHCAHLEITADKSKPIDTRWPAERQ